ncbi:MAG: DUF6273 domain-containing protein [Oscillospiraceae bacterium]|nr:DUF6273 domain-containing protein [Oscillospiraceae bacterium]
MKKALSLLLAAALALGLLALAPLTASAAGVPSVGDKVYFGQYPQSEITSTTGLTAGVDYVTQGGKYSRIEPIAWKVLSNSGGELFLLAEKVLDAKAYNTEWTDVTWETCTMRKFLNGTAGNPEAYSFINWAFTTAEQAAIKTAAVANPGNPDYSSSGGNATNDKIFLLSIQEAKNTAYGFPSGDGDDASRVAYLTGYAAKMANATAGDADWWWLRSPGGSQPFAAIVGDVGDVGAGGNSVNAITGPVRPALKLNLASVAFTTEGGKTLVTLATATAPGITGPTTMSLTAGYAATSTGVYTLTGAPAPTVTKQSGNAAITWNDTTKKLDIAAGLAAGTYPVVLKAANGTTPDATLTFTLTVNPAGVTTYAVTVNNGAGSNNYAAGATVSITADAAPSGKVFDRWTATGVTLSNPTSASTSFTMPANAVTLTATYKDAGGGTDDTKYVGLFGINTAYPSNCWNWFMFIALFGWVWMWLF